MVITRRVFLPLLLLAVALNATPVAHAARGPLPDPVLDDAASPPGRDTLVLAGGCFWGMEEVFQHVRGVRDVTSGYAGGTAGTATYEQVSSGRTGHAESVQIRYDRSKVSMGQLLKVFFSVAHDPTQRGGQGPDRGTQYRSVIFFSTERQQQLAMAYIAQLNEAHVFAGAITTQVARLAKFYEAEIEQQDYAARNPDSRYIRMFDRPKVEALRRELPGLYAK